MTNTNVLRVSEAGEIYADKVIGEIRRIAPGMPFTSLPISENGLRQTILAAFLEGATYELKRIGDAL